MKKCLLLIPRMGNGGAERVMATIANNLCEDYNIRIVTLTDDNSFYNLNSAVEIVGLGQTVSRKNKAALLASTAAGGAKAFIQLHRMIKEWKPDVLLSFLQSANAIAILLKMMGANCRLIVSERCDPAVRNWLNRYFEYHFYKKADGIVCQSNAAADFFDCDTKAKITIIPNPISADAIPPIYTGNRRKCVVGVGRLDKQKNFSMLINAFAKLPEALSDFTLEIYGGGNQEQALRKQILELGLENRAFLMGVKRNVMHFISDAALYVMSSDFEGFPNALVEAMATGLPVISTDFSTGVARELIHEKNGRVIPVGDETALVEAMTEILLDETQWNTMSLENRELLNALSEERIMRTWEDVLQINQ